MVHNVLKNREIILAYKENKIIYWIFSSSVHRCSQTCGYVSTDVPTYEDLPTHEDTPVGVEAQVCSLMCPHMCPHMRLPHMRTYMCPHVWTIHRCSHTCDHMWGFPQVCPHSDWGSICNIFFTSTFLIYIEHTIVFCHRTRDGKSLQNSTGTTLSLTMCKKCPKACKKRAKWHQKMQKYF